MIQFPHLFSHRFSHLFFSLLSEPITSIITPIILLIHHSHPSLECPSLASEISNDRPTFFLSKQYSFPRHHQFSLLTWTPIVFLIAASFLLICVPPSSSSFLHHPPCVSLLLTVVLPCTIYSSPLYKSPSFTLPPSLHLHNLPIPQNVSPHPPSCSSPPFLFHPSPFSLHPLKSQELRVTSEGGHSGCPNLPLPILQSESEAWSLG